MAKLAIKSVVGPTINRTRPINVMFDKDVDEMVKRWFFQGLYQVLFAAGAQKILQVRNFDVWRNENWLDDDDYLTEWNSVDWYIAYIEERSRDGQLHGGNLLRLLYSEPWQEAEPHYDILVTNRDLYDDDCDFCIGLAISGFGAIISTNRFQGLPATNAIDCIVTEIMHELGHVFGLVPETRRTNVTRSLGLHCTNRCIMRQGLVVPHDWQAITADRIKGHVFCKQCRRDLKRYFQ